MHKIGIVQIIDSLNAGGAEVLAVNISNELAKKERFNSVLCATRKEGVLKQNINKDVNYIFLEKKKSIDFNALLKFKKQIKKYNIKIIHAHSSSYFFAFLLKIFYPKLAIIWHDHYGKSQNLSKRKLFPIKICSFFFKTIISVNNKLKIWAEKKLKCENVVFLNNYTTFSNFNETTILKGNPGKRVIHIAGFREQKDHLNLIAGFSDFYNKHPEWTLHLVGKIYENLYSKQVLKKIKDLNLQDAIFVYNECTDIKFILNQSDIGILSSKSEGLPISMLEYGLAGLPVIVTNVGECGKVIENNISGLVIKKEKSRQISKALNILASSKSKRNLYAKNFNKTVLKKYSKSIFFDNLLDIYNIDTICKK